MRRSLPLAATLAAILAGLAPHPSAADPAARPPARPAVPHRTGQPPGPTDIATELDPTVVVPALQDAFGDRYGGHGIEDRRHDDALHGAGVDATEAHPATAAGLTRHHPRAGPPAR